ncbi:putative uncharacterized protein [Clostridium sp. CAG:230]|nr:putative uncharacterized protein [Clostridium sp. CAG:230]
MKKRKITMLFLIAGLLFSGCGKSDASDATDISSIELKSNQKIVIGKITEIAGNEMTYTILKQASAKSSSSDQSKNSNSGNAPDQNGHGNDSSNTGNTPDQSSSSNDSSNSGNASDQGSNDNDSSNGSGGMPAMQNGSSKSKSTSKSKSNTNSKKKSMTMYTSTNKSATMTIPVGTDVITSLGNKTTFSRLSNGDVIKMIVETDQDGNKVIVGIWMV